MDGCLSCLVQGVLEQEVTLSERPPSYPHAQKASSFSDKATSLAYGGEDRGGLEIHPGFSDIVMLPAVPMGSLRVLSKASLQSISQSHLTWGLFTHGALRYKF